MDETQCAVTTQTVSAVDDLSPILSTKTKSRMSHDDTDKADPTETSDADPDTETMISPKVDDDDDKDKMTIPQPLTTGGTDHEEDPLYQIELELTEEDRLKIPPNVLKDIDTEMSTMTEHKEMD